MHWRSLATCGEELADNEKTSVYHVLIGRAETVCLSPRGCQWSVPLVSSMTRATEDKHDPCTPSSVM